MTSVLLLQVHDAAAHTESSTAVSLEPIATSRVVRSGEKGVGYKCGVHAQVNADAPTYTDNNTGVSVKPVASSQVVSNKGSGAQADGTANAASNTVTASATPAGVLQTPDQNSL